MDPADPPPPALRDAATVILLREPPGGGAAAGVPGRPPELLMLRRHARSGFAASAWVFPGGVVDPADSTLDPACWEGIDPDALTGVVGKPAGTVLGLHVAAVRETFEEAGVLLARHRDGAEPDVAEPGFRRMRAALAQRSGLGGRPAADFHRWVAEAGLVLQLGALTPYLRWLTPVQEPRRYDAVFFLARAPQGQVAGHDRVETTGSRWMTAAAASAAAARGELHVIYPTARTLEELAAFPSAAALLGSVDRAARLRPLQPHMVLDGGGRITGILHPDDPDYPWDRYPELAT